MISINLNQDRLNIIYDLIEPHIKNVFIDCYEHLEIFLEIIQCPVIQFIKKEYILEIYDVNNMKYPCFLFMECKGLISDQEQRDAKQYEYLLKAIYELFLKFEQEDLKILQLIALQKYRTQILKYLKTDSKLWNTYIYKEIQEIF